MPNTQQRLFILTSNRRIRKGLLLIPELPGSLEDDAYEWIIVARNSALCSWSPPTLLYCVECAGCAGGARQGVRGTSVSCRALLAAAQPSAAQRSSFPSKPLLNTQTASC